MASTLRLLDLGSPVCPGMAVCRSAYQGVRRLVLGLVGLHGASCLVEVVVVYLEQAMISSSAPTRRRRAAGRRDAGEWISIIVILAVVGICGTVSLFIDFLYGETTYRPAFQWAFDVIQFAVHTDDAQTFQLLPDVLLVAYRLPLSVAALWYGRRLAAAGQDGG